jgi:hypothetical protein
VWTVNKHYHVLRWTTWIQIIGCKNILKKTDKQDTKRSVDCKQTLPRSKVDHLDTNHRMQKYGGKTDNQDTKRRVWTVDKHYHVLGWATWTQIIGCKNMERKKTDNQDPRRRVWTVNKHYHVLRWTTWVQIIGCKDILKKTDNQDTKRRVWTVDKHYHVLRWTTCI